MAKTKIEVSLIDKQKFEQLVRLGMNDLEIMNLFMVNSYQLYAWVKRAYDTKHPMVLIKKLRAEGKAEFLIKQRKLAEKNAAMSIWFGKNFYDQTDSKEIDTSADYEDLNPLTELLKDDTDAMNNEMLSQNQEVVSDNQIENQNVDEIEEGATDGNSND